MDNQVSAVFTVREMHSYTCHICDSMFSLTDRIFGNRGGKQFIFRILSPEKPPLEVATATEDDMLEWMQEIRNCTRAADDKVTQGVGD